MSTAFPIAIVFVVVVGWIFLYLAKALMEPDPSRDWMKHVMEATARGEKAMTYTKWCLVNGRKP